MQQIRYDQKTEKAPDLERPSICNNDLVRQVDSKWNHFEADLRLLHLKLERFGLIFINGEIIYAYPDDP